VLPAKEREIIEQQARDYAARFRGSLRDTMFEFGKVRFTIEHHGHKLMTFEQWKAAGSPSRAESA